MNDPSDDECPLPEELHAHLHRVTSVPFAWKVAVAAFMFAIILGLAAVAFGPHRNESPPEMACRPSPVATASLAAVTSQVQTAVSIADRKVAEPWVCA